MQLKLMTKGEGEAANAGRAPRFKCRFLNLPRNLIKKYEKYTSWLNEPCP